MAWFFWPFGTSALFIKPDFNAYLDIDFSDSDSTTILTTQVFLDNHCPPVFARHLYWNWTRAGDVAIQPCPEGSTGLARWACDAHALSFRGGQPDMSDCKSSQVSDLETRVREEDPENVIVSTLERLTEKGKLCSLLFILLFGLVYLRPILA